MANLEQSKRNWWKYGFFALLLIFEITREIAVLSASAGARPTGMASFFHTINYATARGTWTRTDGGERLIPAAVTIECDRSLGICIEATSSIFENYVFAPEIDRFQASFSADGIRYENDIPDCAKYTVRLDFQLRVVDAVRERKTNPTNERCRLLEPRVEMRLQDATSSDENLTDGHFVPIIWLLQKVS